jgi:hypothetical protein
MLEWTQENQKYLRLNRRVQLNVDILGRGAKQRQRELINALEQLQIVQPPNKIPVATVRATATGEQQPTDPDHPGGSFYPYTDFTVDTYRIWNIRGISIYPVDVTYLVPKGALPYGNFPVMVVSPGKFLDRYEFYAALLRHCCLKGYIVLFVDVDTWLLDSDHSRMADDFLKAVWQTFSRKIMGLVNSPVQMVWWGHSLGAKVQLIAVRNTRNRYYLRPTAVLANNFSNTAGTGPDALRDLSGIPLNVWYTNIAGELDTISGDDPRRLFNGLKYLPHRQLIIGTGADHFTPLTDPLLNRVNHLEWWLYWKFVVGAADYHFRQKSDKWAYGSERADGGTDENGNPVIHKVIEN